MEFTTFPNSLSSLVRDPEAKAAFERDFPVSEWNRGGMGVLQVPLFPESTGEFHI